MSDFDLLSAVQPKDGWYAVVGISGSGKVKQRFAETREEFDTLVDQMVEEQRNVFFGVAKYNDDSGRTKGNVRALRALWLDIDCGEGKPYPDQSSGFTALRKFVKTVGLPKPTVVNSGRGMHVYWATTEDMDRTQWEALAARLHTLCTTQGLHADPACFEVARILRVPGTFNFKGEEPLPVTVVTQGNPTEVAELFDILGAELPKVALFGTPSKRPMSALGKQVLDSVEASFKKLVKRSMAGDGCAQIVSCIEDRATLEEPRWFNALSIAKFCKDKVKAVGVVSEGHPDFELTDALQKMEHILGPHSCVEFEKNNPEACKGCPFKGKITSPISLAKEVQAADPDEVITPEPSEDEDEDTRPYRRPTPPFPYMWGKKGGLWRKAQGEEAEDTMVYEHDLYVVKRMEDPEHGECTMMRLHLPKDGLKEFVVSNFKVMDATELRKVLASKGVMTDRKRFDLIVDYIIRSVKELQCKKRAEHMRNQFGWADKDSKFIIGNREVSVNGVYYSPSSSSTEAIAINMNTAGTFEKWKEVFDLYGEPGLEAHAFAAATAFGAPLLKFSGHSGAIFNLIHPNSGTGKTTILHMCNSVWGHPKNLCAKKDDTFNSKVHKIGVHNTLPICFDEMSNTEPKQLSELAYLITQGTGKDRMKASSNELRINQTSWRTIALCSSNHSFYEKLEFLKDSPEGEVMRIIEFYIDYNDVIETSYAKQMFDHQLMQNYGHAGEIYAEYIVTNREYAERSYLDVQRQLDTVLKLTQRERFWSAAVAANLTGIRIAKHIGLCDWDITRIFKWVCKRIIELRKTAIAPIEHDKEIVGQFILNHMQSILVVDDGVDRRSSMASFPILEPKRELAVRYEPDTKKVYIVVKTFKDFCQTRNISYRETVRKLEACGLLIGMENKRLSKGMTVTTTPVRALVFDAKHPDFISIDDLSVIKDASGKEEEDAN